MRAFGASRHFLLIALLALPTVLLLSSVRTYQELEKQRAVYLRSLAGMIAGRLENIPPDEPASDILDALSDEEPALVDLSVIAPGYRGRDSAALEPIWHGQELFRTSFLTVDGERIFRAYVPFHMKSGLRIARIDLAAGAADFLLVHARHNLIVAAAGGLVLVLVAFYVVWSARKAAEMEHLAHMGKMAAVLAHEIRNPLGTIKGFAQLAGEQADSGVKGLLEPILTETARLEKLVNDLLLYSRPPLPSVQLTEWQEIAQELQANARQMIGNRSIRFTCDTGARQLRTDPSLLRQALINLVRNAVEAVGDLPDGAVKLQIEQPNRDGLIISVSDNGVGIAEPVRERLFEPFFTTKAFGTGLGLAITRKLAAALGGRLEFHSVEPHGTEAVLHLPQPERS